MELLIHRIETGLLCEEVPSLIPLIVVQGKAQGKRRNDWTGLNWTGRDCSTGGQRPRSGNRQKKASHAPSPSPSPNLLPPFASLKAPSSSPSLVCGADAANNCNDHPKSATKRRQRAPFSLCLSLPSLIGRSLSRTVALYRFISFHLIHKKSGSASRSPVPKSTRTNTKQNKTKRGPTPHLGGGPVANIPVHAVLHVQHAADLVPEVPQDPVEHRQPETVGVALAAAAAASRAHV